MTTAEEIYGQDILLDETMQAKTAANGDVVVSTGIETVLQDIKLRLFTPLGSLFYDVDFGSNIMLFVKEENTATTRRALIAEVKRRLNLEPRVVPETTTCSIVTWDHTGVTLKASFRLIDETHPFNLVISAGSNLEMVIKDVNTG